MIFFVLVYIIILIIIMGNDVQFIVYKCTGWKELVVIRWWLWWLSVMKANERSHLLKCGKNYLMLRCSNLFSWTACVWYCCWVFAMKLTFARHTWNSSSARSSKKSGEVDVRYDRLVKIARQVWNEKRHLPGSWVLMDPSWKTLLQQTIAPSLIRQHRWKQLWR